MNTTEANQTAPPISTQDAEFLIAVGYIPAPIYAAHWGVFHLLRRLIQHRLKLAGIEANPGGVVQPPGVLLSQSVILSFTVSNHAAALAALSLLIDELGEHGSGLAYYRQDSKRWHSVRGVVFDYEAALTDKNIHAAATELERQEQEHHQFMDDGQEILQALQRLNPSEPTDPE